MKNIFKPKNFKFNKKVLGSSSPKSFKCFQMKSSKKSFNMLELKSIELETNFISKRFLTIDHPVGEHPMFCFQCEQTNHAKGCTTKGVCGKTPEVSRLQDLLMHGVKGLGFILAELGKLDVRYKAADRFVLNALFASMTNVNFDDHRYVVYLQQCEEFIREAKRLYLEMAKKRGAVMKNLPFETDFVLKGTYLSQLIEQSMDFGIEKRKKQFGDDYVGMQELIFYGLKGLCAYAEHASQMSFESDEIYQEIALVLQFLTEQHTVPEMLEMALKVGALNLKVMDLLDTAHVFKFGNPEPTVFRTSAVKGKCVAISGHDLGDLESLLKQTEGKGINVYTHGEMLPGNAYPMMKKYKHFIGNYGGAWQNQKFEFATFPGPIIMTSNCIVAPKPSYVDRIWTKSVVGFPGVKHLENNDFSQVIEQALSLPGFAQDEKESFATTGFGRNSVLSVAGPVIEAVKSGAIKHFFLIGGCDGHETERNYFKEVALATPKDTMILTLACGKYRFNKLEFGNIGGIPRLLDMGQCNDSYSAIQVAGALANAFGCEVNQLPLSYVVSWLEQKSVAVLLTLLHLNIQNIRLGTALPAFVTPNMLNILVEKYKIKPITDVKKDVEDMMLNR